MLENLLFSLDATMPLFLLMVIGWCLKKVKMIDPLSTAVINRVVFRIFLPALLFSDLIKQDINALWDTKFVLYCVIVTIISIIIATLLSSFFKEDRGEFIQGSFRSAAATLGIAYMTNIYEDSSMIALMIIGCVPVYNIFSVIILSLTAERKTKDYGKYKETFKRTYRNLITNPIIISVVAGLVWSLFRLPKVPILDKCIGYLGNIASPLALIGLGASFEICELREKLKPILCICFNKLVLFSVIFIPVGIMLGFRDEKIVAALIMLGSATTSSSFIMAKNMGHKGIISSGVVMMTTLFSSFTMTVWIFLLKSMNYIQ